MSVHDLSEHTKRLLDILAAASAGVAITLSQAALIVSIGAGLMSFAWYCLRFYDRFKHGRGGND